MSNIVKELKTNKFTTIIFFIFLFLFILGWILYGMVIPKSGKPVYGNRLDGIEKVEITSAEKEKIISSLKGESVVTSAQTDIKGKIINVLVEVKSGTKVSTAKKLSSKVTESLSKDQLSFYDIQIFITSGNKNSKSYPVIGYKSSTSKGFTY